MRQVVILQIILLLIQCILYFGCEKFQHNLHDVKSPLDDGIPFLPWTVILYCCWFPLIALFPIAVYFTDAFYYWIYMISMIAEIIISVACYLIYPTTFERPEPPKTFWGRFMKLVYFGSYRGLNCAPSLHCSSCYLIICTACLCTEMPAGIRILAIVAAILIVLSTMTTKQHTILDVITAVPVFLLSLLFGLNIVTSHYPVLMEMMQKL